jgi:hypothetical protein
MSFETLTAPIRERRAIFADRRDDVLDVIRRALRPQGPQPRPLSKTSEMRWGYSRCGMRRMMQRNARSICGAPDYASTADPVSNRANSSSPISVCATRMLQRRFLTR